MAGRNDVIDISKWNTNINYDLAAQNLGLVIARVQYGSNKVDELYGKHVTEFEKRGIAHAAYAYGCYVSVADAVQEAKDFLARVSPKAKFLVLDVEDDTLASCGGTNLRAASQAFIDHCKAAGWRVGLYVAHHMYGSYGLSNLKADFLWLPRYSTTPPSYTCDLWQYADGATGGTYEGIGACDRNRFMNGRTLEWLMYGDKQPNPQGLGTVTSIYADGYGINLYSNPANPVYEGNITQKIPYIVWDYYENGNDSMVCLGSDKQWAYVRHFTQNWYRAYSKYPSGYGVNTYDAPNGNYTGNVDGSTSYGIWHRVDGWIAIENTGKWVKEEHFTIK